MTIALYGTGVSRGIAIGKCYIVRRGQPKIQKYHIKKYQIRDEIKRFTEAVAKAQAQLGDIRKHIPAATSADIAGFIDTHLLMLKDDALITEPKRIIEKFACNAEWALQIQRDALVAIFDEMADPYLRTRKDDLAYVVSQIQRLLMNQRPLPQEMTAQQLSKRIVLADDLTPADTVLIQHHGIIALATELSGPTSHTAILSQSLGIPAIVGLQHALEYVTDEDQLILDGMQGVILINPSKQILAHYRQLRRAERHYRSGLKKLHKKPAVTLDKTIIDLQANIELPADFSAVAAVGANGVGLYRTEFLYMNRNTPPDEAEHYAAYIKVVDILNGLPLTIRTLDLGADIPIILENQSNPVAGEILGLRAVRLYLKNPRLFLPQLRAIIRASAQGPVRLMLPMLSSIHEVRQILQMVKEVMLEFEALQIPYDRELQIGGMIEVPAAAICADIFARQLDFLSIGTNDLIQYTMAVDRDDEEVSYLYDPLNPAVLRLIHTTLEAGKKQNTPVIMCGEMAGEIRYTQLLLGLGLRKFSIHPSVLPEVKKVINQSDLIRLEAMAARALNAENGIEVAEIIYSLE